MKEPKYLFGAVMAFACVLLLGLAAPPAEAQIFVGQTPGLTSLLTNVMPVTTSATTNVVGPVVLTLRNKQGLAVTAKVGTTNAGVNTGNIGIGLAVSPDGTNYTTVPYVWLVGPANSTGAAVFATNFSSLLMDNFQFAKVITITNANTNTFYFTNLTASYY